MVHAALPYPDRCAGTVCRRNWSQLHWHCSSFATDLKLYCFSEPTRERGRHDVVIRLRGDINRYCSWFLQYHELLNYLHWPGAAQFQQRSLGGTFKFNIFHCSFANCVPNKISFVDRRSCTDLFTPCCKVWSRLVGCMDLRVYLRQTRTDRPTHRELISYL